MTLVIYHLSFIIGHWSLVIGHWSLVIGHWSNLPQKHSYKRIRLIFQAEHACTVRLVSIVTEGCWLFCQLGVRKIRLDIDTYCGVAYQVIQ
jgi:hypothetical protein